MEPAIIMGKQRSQALLGGAPKRETTPLLNQNPSEAKYASMKLARPSYPATYQTAGNEDDIMGTDMFRDNYLRF